jgi:HEAT repeat protein
VALWLSALKSKNVEARRKVIEQLCAKPNGRALRTLRQALEDDDTQVRRLGATALGKLEDLEDDHLELLLKALKDPEPEVQRAAIPGLKRFPMARTIDAIVPMLRSHDTGVRVAAAQSLEALGWRPTKEDDEIWYWAAKGQFNRLSAFGTMAIPILEVILDSGSYSQCVGALQVLGQIDDPDVVRPLVRGLRVPDSAVVVAAVDALGKVGGPQAIQHLTGMLHHHTAQVRLAAIEALGSLRAPGVGDLLKKLLSDEVWEVRKVAADTLGRLREVDSIEALSKTLSDKDADVREAAVGALARLGVRKVIGPLVSALKDSNSGVRRVASVALTRVDENWNTSPEGRAALEALRPALQDKDSDVRHFVGHLLASLGAAEPEPAAAEAEGPGLDMQDRRRKLAIALFLAILCDPDRDLRQAAAEALGQLGGSRAQAGLLRAVADRDPGVRRAAEVALRALHDKPGGRE